MSMYSHRGYTSRDSRYLKFSTQAAVQLQRRHNKSSNHYDGAVAVAAAAAGQLLDDLSHKDSMQLKSLVHKTFSTCNVNLIHTVNAPQMYGMYLLRKEEMRLAHVGQSDKELILYHVTTKSRAVESLKNGLDWRRTRRSKFGNGVSFSDDADYANYYADKFTKEDSRVIIVCAVLVNKTHRVSGKRNEGNLIVPPGSVDTTVSPNGRVYVKYNDYDFYPLYFMHYQRTPEHLNESKYFHNNPHSKWQQNNRVVQQQQQQRELQAQRERERAQRERELRAQREQEAWRQQEKQQAQRYLDQLRQEQELQERRRREREQELSYSRQAQGPRSRESNSNCLIL
ncbi:probable serine/threonine-protein kinase DDB_G0267686 [Myzus persicae]|uniref:probable serine/threonine-protein kinase DDB_G0267686 n=1 Tax=Myzus persicae TaxID=13164 RepID=UPI000B9385CA|nr:probable serine/threonine-protein kinase DDB_G0267686 [Myzus persicae]XP_022168126.1 probable serine/threonine-protein kinase DDB_G0267686 [Myzus persicae]